MTRRASALWVAWALVLLLGACASPSPTPGGWSGRLSVDVSATEASPARRASVGFELGGDASKGTLELEGPLGALLARARWQAGRVELDDGREQRRFASLGELAEASLGEPLPLEAFFDWLRGRPWPGAASAPRADGLPGFVQGEWQVDTSRLASGVLRLHRPAPPAITVHIRLDRDAPPP